MAYGLFFFRMLEATRATNYSGSITRYLWSILYERKRAGLWYRPRWSALQLSQVQFDPITSDQTVSSNSKKKQGNTKLSTLCQS